MSLLVGEPDGATPLEPEEMEGLKFKHVATRGQLDELEQANIQEGLEWLIRQKNKNLFAEGFVRELHTRLFGRVWSWAGTFRSTEKNIGIDPMTIAVELRNLLDNTRFWVEHNTYPPIEIAVRFHHRLVQIHLFPNGNGRHARIMADAILKFSLKHSPINWAAGTDLQKMNERRNKYIAALRAADGNNYNLLFKFVGIKPGL